MGNQKLENIEAIAFFSIITFNGIIFSTSKIIFNDSISGSLINAVLITFLASLVVIAYSFLLKKFEGKDLLTVSDYLGRKNFKILYWYCIYYLFYSKSLYFLKKNKQLFGNCILPNDKYYFYRVDFYNSNRYYLSI